MTFGAVIDVLAVIGAGTCAYWATLSLRRLLPFSRIRAFGRTPVFRRATRENAAGGSRPDEGLRRDSFQKHPVRGAEPGPADVPPDHIAAIAAAVAALDAGLKVVHIADAATGRDWVSEGRWAHQTSHQTSRRPR